MTLRIRILTIVAAVALMLSVAGGVSADKGGEPNANACHGQIVAFFASELGITPADAANFFEVNAGQVNKFVKFLCDEFINGG
jgi:hypothetical protein